MEYEIGGTPTPIKKGRFIEEDGLIYRERGN